MKVMWQVIGCVTSSIGIFALIEANRLKHFQAAFGFGAGTFPLVLGASLVLIGVYLALTAGRGSALELTWPHGHEARAIWATLSTLVLYCVGITLLGYYSASFLAAAVLFRTIGRYSYARSVIGAGVCTGVLYLTLDYVAGMSLPSGAIG